MLRLLILLSFLRGDIVARGDTAVELGQDALFSCSLSDASGVKQVTWQRVRNKETVQTLATFSDLFKHQVDEQYVGKVTFTAASANSTSIKISNATFEDEACYICSFKVYPFQPKRQTLCLTVKGISEMTMLVNPARSTDQDVVVSCSATGKPTPNIQWKSAEEDLNNYRSSNFSTLNKDSSTTITSNLTLPLSEFNGKFVECVAQSDIIEKSSQISVPEKDYKENKVTLRNYIIPMMVLIIISIFIIAIYLHTKFNAYLSDIVARGNTSVEFGQDALFSCSMSDASGVKQVTWQRVRNKETVQTLATYSDLFKHQVDEQYVGKVTFIAASANSTSIEIKNATFEDEACYICSFKVYPFQPKRQTLCLTVKGLTEITTSVNPAPNTDQDVVVSCSATGKPAPTIQWKSAGKDLNNFSPSNFSTLNKDSSTTITSNLTLPLSEFNGKFVECVAQSDSVEKSEQIYVPVKDYNVNNDTTRSYIITLSVLICMAVVVLIITIICLYTRLKRTTFGKKSTYEEHLNAPSEEC
ncbi:OX-2 membrane glyco -like protein [Labeo rohita]|uniref:OX-2 membrane glyco-like protein n=1 Tax=Labeo rohita TaxID=84645 RepID=A0A498LFZ2_LABRO|nr:OX-2 membrane glyco -like protein [Labeo rohita]